MGVFPRQLVKGLSKRKHRNDQSVCKTSGSGGPAVPGRGEGKEPGGAAQEALDLMVAGMRGVVGALSGKCIVPQVSYLLLSGLRPQRLGLGAPLVPCDALTLLFLLVVSVQAPHVGKSPCFVRSRYGCSIKGKDGD